MIDLKEIKSKILRSENLYFLIIITVIFAADRYSKIKILSNLSENSLYINDFINLDLVWNTGIGFGLLSFESTLIYNLISILIFTVIIVLIYIALISEKIDKVIFSIIIGGAIGNVYDRIFYSAVPDFIDLHYANFHWFTFNVADIFITIGVITLIFKEILIKK